MEIANEMKDFRNKFRSIIEKYNNSNWSWFPNGFESDWSEVTERTIIHPLENLKKDKKSLEKDKQIYDVIFELEKEITNPLFFWSVILPIYKKTTFSQIYVDKFIDSFTRFNRLDIQLQKRMACIKRYKEYWDKVLFREKGAKLHPGYKTNQNNL